MIEKIKRYADFEDFISSSVTSTIESGSSAKRSSSRTFSSSFRQNPWTLCYYDQSIENDFIDSFYGKNILWRFGITQFSASIIFIQFIYTAYDFAVTFFWLYDVIIGLVFGISSIFCFIPPLVKSSKFKRVYEVWITGVLCIALLCVTMRESYYLATEGLFLLQFGFLYVIRLRIVCTFHLLLISTSFNVVCRLIFNLFLIQVFHPTYCGNDALGLLTPTHCIKNFFQVTLIFTGLYVIEKYEREGFKTWVSLTQAKQRLQKERRYTDILLCNIVPKTLIGDVLNSNEPYLLKQVHKAVVLEADLEGFTRKCSAFSSPKIMKTMNTYITEFDKLTNFFDGEKVKSAGDSYLVVFSKKVELEKRAILFAAAQIMIVKDLVTDFCDSKLRVGCAVGPIVQMILKKRLFSFDIYGEAVTLSKVLESEAPANCVKVSQAIWASTKDHFEYTVTEDLNGSRSLVLDVEKYGFGVIKCAKMKRLIESRLKYFGEGSMTIDMEEDKYKHNTEDNVGRANPDTSTSVDDVEVKPDRVLRLRKYISKLLIQSGGYMPIVCVFRSQKKEFTYQRELFRSSMTTASQIQYFSFNIGLCLITTLSYIDNRLWSELYSIRFVIVYLSILASFVLIIAALLIRALKLRLHVFPEIGSIIVFSLSLAGLISLPHYKTGQDNKRERTILNLYWYQGIAETFMMSFSITNYVFVKHLFLAIYYITYIIKFFLILGDQLIPGCFVDPTITLVGALVHINVKELYLRKLFIRQNFEKKKGVELGKEIQKNKGLILSVLPESILHRIHSETEICDEMENMALCFLKIVEKNQHSNRSKRSLLEYVKFLSQCFINFDDIFRDLDVWKVKSVESTYFSVSESLLPMLLALKRVIAHFKGIVRMKRLGKIYALKIGVCMGNVSSGLVGFSKLLWDVLGSSCNLASRLCESSNIDNKIHVIEDNVARAIEEECLPISLRAHEICFIKGVGATKACYVYFEEDFDETLLLGINIPQGGSQQHCNRNNTEEEEDEFSYGMSKQQNSQIKLNGKMQ